MSASGCTEKEIEGSMFHLDYLSCILTVLASILLARKYWIGLLIATVNSLVVCAIALRTSQLGLIPANLFCICVYAFSMRSWLNKPTYRHRDQAQRQSRVAVADGARISPANSECSIVRSQNSSDCTRRGHPELRLASCEERALLPAVFSAAE